MVSKVGCCSESSLSNIKLCESGEGSRRETSYCEYRIGVEEDRMVLKGMLEKIRNRPVPKGQEEE